MRCASSVRFVAALAVALMAPLSVLEIKGQSGGLFAAVTAPRGAAPAAARGDGGAPLVDGITLRSRLVTVDLEMLARAASGTSLEPDSTALPLNLFDDVAFTGIVEGRTPTFSGGYALMGRIEGVEPGSMTLVVNGTVVAGSVRTPTATYRIRPAGASMHTVSQIDSSRLPEGAEPLTAESLEVDPFEADLSGGELSGDGDFPFPPGGTGSRRPR